MDAVPDSIMDYALALVGLLWVGSVFLLVFAVGRYFAARAQQRAASRATPQDPYRDARPASEPFVAANFVPQADGSVARLAAESANEGISSDDQRSIALEAEEQDQRPAPFATHILPRARPPREDLIAAVRSRVAHDREAAQGVAELVRALYLDRSNFRFETISALGDDDRRLAVQLVEEWLADPSAIEFWQTMYAALEAPEQAARVAQPV